MPTLADLTWPVLTEQLSIRPATAADAEAVWRYRRLPEVERFMTALAGTLSQFAEAFGAPERLAATLVVERDGVVIGDLKAAVENAWTQSEVAEHGERAQAEVGWALDPAEQGKGYASEAVRALLQICFERLQVRRVVAYCFAVNEPSWRLMERVGMRREAHTIADGYHREGGWMDGFSYALLGSQWRSAHGR